MRRFLLPVLALAAVPLTPACGNGSSGGAPADAGPFTYAPQGCAYTVTPPDSRGYTDLANDDPNAAADPQAATPARVRLGLGGGTTAGKPGYADPTTSAVFTWETPGAVAAARVKLGTDPGSLGDVHAGYVFGVPPPETGIGTSEPPGHFHEVHVCGLQPGRTYYYAVGGGSGAGVWSATQSFTTPPASGKIVVGFDGDSRDDPTVFSLVQARMRDAGVALQFYSGDLVYFGAQASQYAKWLDAAWKDPKDPGKFLTLGQQIILSTGGNHEAQSAQFFANFALPGDGPYAESFASFDLGSAHFVLVDDDAIANLVQDQTSAQLAWLEQDLTAAEANRSARPFLVALHHRGEYSTSKHGGDVDVLATRTQLSPVWARHHVDLVINGHDHNYERTKPIVPAADPKQPPTVQPSTTQGGTYVVCAGAGVEAYPPGTSTADWRAINAGYGQGTPYVGVYGLLTLDGNKATMKAYGLKASGGGVAGDDVLDTVDFTR